jgi:D-alanyl-D-alanine carboxypeptidase (penicillin-binding protein 5/6)
MLASDARSTVNLPSMSRPAAGSATTRVRATLGVLAATVLLGTPVSPALAATTSPSVVGGERLASTGLVVDAPGSTPLPQLGASSYLLADLTTGEVLAAKNPHGRLRPASTQKVLTALTLLPRLDPDAVYTAQWEDANVDGSRAGLVPDATYTVHQMFQALFLVSGNDAASALANAAGGIPQTVAAMNATAKSLGALDTTVRNPSGLDAPGQYTSAYDLAVVARTAMARQDFRDYVTTVKAQFPGKMAKPGKVRKTFEIYTQDRLLLNYRGAIGVKTGWTTKARGTFVGAATRGGRTLVATVMHSDVDSWRAAAALLTWGFQNGSLARPVGTLDAAAKPATTSDGKTVAAGPSSQPREAATAGGGRGLSWWRATLLLLVAALAALRARVLLLRRRGRRRSPLMLPPQSRVPRRVRIPASPAPTAAPTSTPRTVRVLRDDPTPSTPTGTES